MSSPRTARSKALPAWARWGIGALVVVAVFAVFPPFRILSLEAIHAAEAAVETYDPIASAEAFWSGELQSALGSAQPVAPILAALAVDPAQATEQFGQSVGLGAAYYFAQGTAEVVEIRSSEVIVRVDGGPLLVSLRSGPVFGNVVRDGCGLLEVNDFPGVAEFNALSAELNRLVEERVQPALTSELAVGARLEFVGCAEALESLPVGKPALKIIPVAVSVLP